MKKIPLLFLLTILLIKPCRAQRLSLTDLIDIYELTLPSNYNVQKLNNAVHNNASNWSEVQSSRNKTEVSLNWTYRFDGTTRGILTILKDDEPIFPIRLVFKFPYAVQYNDYLEALKAHAELVNVATNNGKQERFYEFKHLSFVLTTYPAELKRYYAEGRPAPLYEIFIQLNKN